MKILRSIFLRGKNQLFLGLKIWNLFFAHENIKTRASKVAHNQPQTFFAQAWPDCPNRTRIDFSYYKWVQRLICLLICERTQYLPAPLTDKNIGTCYLGESYHELKQIVFEIETRISNGLWHSACRASPVTYVEINLFMQDMCKYGHMPNAKKVGLTQILATPLLILITLWYFRYFSIFEKVARTLEIPQTRKEPEYKIKIIEFSSWFKPGIF